MMEDIKSIHKRLDKMDNIEKIVTSVSMKLTDLETQVKNIEIRVRDVETSSSFVSEKYEQQARTMKTAQESVKQMQDSCTSLNSTIREMTQKQEEMKAKLLDSEFRSMRDNLIFYGIPEGTGPNSENEQEASDRLVKNIINDVLKINPADIVFDRAHRLGNPRKATKPRPIIVKFHYYSQHEKVRKVAFDLKADLKKSNYGVGIQLPKEWRDARRNLSAVYQNEKEKGNRVKFVGNKLYINESEYKGPPASVATI